MFKNKLHEELWRSLAFPSTMRVLQHHDVTVDDFMRGAG